MGSRSRNLRFWTQGMTPKAHASLPGAAGGDSERAWDEGLGRGSPRMRMRVELVAHEFPWRPWAASYCQVPLGGAATSPACRTLLAAVASCRGWLRCGPKDAPVPSPRAAGAPSRPLGARGRPGVGLSKPSPPCTAPRRE